MDYTPIARKYLENKARRVERWHTHTAEIQTALLRRMLRTAARTDVGRHYDFKELAALKNPYEAYRRRVPLHQYEDIRDAVMRMIVGERDVLWPGRCRSFAQSSGTSGGKSKYIPITEESLRENHYPGAQDALAHYLHQVPQSKLLSGKAFALGGSFANELNLRHTDATVGDLSATLINRMNPLANMVRIPSKKIALMADWEKKLPALVEASMNCDVTNISGVPSWFLSVIKEIIKRKGVEKISDVWPNLEVFFHGGISFEPYRDIYKQLTDPAKMHFLETYNASEGFFGVQNDFSDPAMLLLIDTGMFYEFKELDGQPVSITDVEVGKVYELILTGVNGLWRYRLGDTIRVESLDPVKIRIAGRTKSFINAFGEEVMEDNAERAIAAACKATQASILNYTAAPVFAKRGSKGRHQWLIEWERKPADISKFAEILDTSLRSLNSDYDAKRQHDLFLDRPEITSAKPGAFDRWLKAAGNHKLGGQRKVPRLSNSRDLIEAVMAL